MSENKHTPEPWSRITAPGQVKPGDKLRFTIGDTPYIETAKEILFKGTDREEIIYNKRRNYYLITSMCMANQGSQKNVHFLSVETIESVKKQRDELLTDRDTWKSRAEFSYQQRDVLEGRASLAEAQRDELLAALVHIQQVACSGSPELGIASEAIASVKGGTANTAADGWIEWKGGACPVDGETIVQCKLREPEGANMKERKAKEWSWKHCSDFNKYDIIAYRVVKGGAA